MRMRRRSAVCLMQSTTPLSLRLMQRVRAQVGARDAQRRRLVPCRLHCRTRIRGPLPIVHASRHLTRIHASRHLTRFSRVGTGCRGRGGRAAKEDQAEGAVGEKAHVIALLRAGVPRGDIAGVAARRDLRHGAGALGRARALAAGLGSTRPRHTCCDHGCDASEHRFSRGILSRGLLHMAYELLMSIVLASSVVPYREMCGVLVYRTV